LHGENKENKIIYGKEIVKNEFEIKGTKNELMVNPGETPLHIAKKGTK
jgi:hypothetical protein